jgi:hypothetical protein
MSVITRRRLLGAGAVTLAGGAGLTAGLLRPRRAPAPPLAPAALVAAAARERAMITSIDAVVDADLRAALASIRADHVQHLEAVDALLAHAAGAGAVSSAPRGSVSAAPTRAQLLAAENAAQAGWAQLSARATGPQAALFASVSACEATHVAALT